MEMDIYGWAMAYLAVVTFAYVAIITCTPGLKCKTKVHGLIATVLGIACDAALIHLAFRSGGQWQIFLERYVLAFTVISWIYVSMLPILILGAAMRCMSGYDAEAEKKWSDLDYLYAKRTLPRKWHMYTNTIPFTIFAWVILGYYGLATAWFLTMIGQSVLCESIKKAIERAKKAKADAEAEAEPEPIN